MHMHDFVFKPQDCMLIAISGQYDIIIATALWVISMHWPMHASG